MLVLTHAATDIQLLADHHSMFLNLNSTCLILNLLVGSGFANLCTGMHRTLYQHSITLHRHPVVTAWVPLHSRIFVAFLADGQDVLTTNFIFDIHMASNFSWVATIIDLAFSWPVASCNPSQPVLSPVASVSARPFHIGYFQVVPAGSLVQHVDLNHMDLQCTVAEQQNWFTGP